MARRHAGKRGCICIQHTEVRALPRCKAAQRHTGGCAAPVHGPLQQQGCAAAPTACLRSNVALAPREPLRILQQAQFLRGAARQMAVRANRPAPALPYLRAPRRP